MENDERCLTEAVKGLTGEILALKARIRECAGVLADIGDRLRRAKELLPRGCWQPWLDRHAGFSRRSAQHYMGLSRLRERLGPAFEQAVAGGLRTAYRQGGERATVARGVRGARGNPPCRPVRAADRDGYAGEVAERLRCLLREAERSREFAGRMSPRAKGEVLALLERLRRRVLGWPAWAIPAATARAVTNAESSGPVSAAVPSGGGPVREVSDTSRTSPPEGGTPARPPAGRDGRGVPAPGPEGHGP